MEPTGLSTSQQDVLKVIWSEQEWSTGAVTSKAIAGRLSLSASTVSETLKRLSSLGLVSHQPYGDVALTESGTRVAVAMVRRHRLLETFLVDYLGYGWDEVHDEAEVLEHAVSDHFIDRLDTRLEHPTRDPHGDPIPGADGVSVQPAARCLADAEPGTDVVVVRVADDEPDLLRYLTDSTIAVDSRLHVAERKDAAGLLVVETAHGDIVHLGSAAAAALWVVTPDA